MTHYTTDSNEIEKNKEVISGMEEIANEAIEKYLVEAVIQPGNLPIFYPT